MSVRSPTPGHVPSLGGAAEPLGALTSRGTDDIEGVEVRPALPEAVGRQAGPLAGVFTDR
jgi:hypothetical protein